MQTRDKTECLERADRLIAEGVVGERGQIASIILEAVQHEREACAKIAESIGSGPYSSTAGWALSERIAEAIRQRKE